jgi:hypothetical protein
MFKRQDFLKTKLGEVSAKTISLGGKRFARGRNEQKVSVPKSSPQIRATSSAFVAVNRMKC